MSKIAVDIDDTLYSFTALAREVLAEEVDNKLYNRAAYAPWTEWRTPPDLLGLDEWIKVIDRCHDDEKILSRDPFPGCQDVLAELAEEHELVYVSNRMTERQEATEKWLDNNNFPLGEVICAQNHDKKSYLTDVQYIIDDRPKTLVQFVHDHDWQGDQRVAFGLMTEYNRSLTDVPNIYLAPPSNWNLLRHYFIKAGVLTEKVYA